MCKETYAECAKRPTHMKSCVLIGKETGVMGMRYRPWYSLQYAVKSQKSIWNVSKKTSFCAKRCIHIQRDVLILKKTVVMEMGYRPWYDLRQLWNVPKETYLQRKKFDAYEKRLR